MNPDYIAAFISEDTSDPSDILELFRDLLSSRFITTTTNREDLVFSVINTDGQKLATVSMSPGADNVVSIQTKNGKELFDLNTVDPDEIFQFILAGAEAQEEASYTVMVDGGPKNFDESELSFSLTPEEWSKMPKIPGSPAPGWSDSSGKIKSFVGRGRGKPLTTIGDLCQYVGRQVHASVGLVSLYNEKGGTSEKSIYTQLKRGDVGIATAYRTYRDWGGERTVYKFIKLSDGAHVIADSNEVQWLGVRVVVLNGEVIGTIQVYWQHFGADIDPEEMIKLIPKWEKSGAFTPIK